MPSIEAHTDPGLGCGANQFDVTVKDSHGDPVSKADVSRVLVPKKESNASGRSRYEEAHRAITIPASHVA